MLFSYSPVGFDNNWLHDILIAILRTDMERLDGGLPRLTWTACIPEAYREALKRKHGLKSRRTTLLDRYEELAGAGRADVRGALARHNAMPGIFDDGLPCVTLSELPEEIREPIKELFDHAFVILSDTKLRDENYKKIYDALQYKVCAFCGVEILDAPGQRREALDHYLPISIYPFAGVNFRNIAPMGGKCNSRYKLTQNILFDPITGNRRACCDPYDSPSISLSLADSRPFEGASVDLVTCPDWVIRWEGGDPHKLQTWEAVFAISDRYRESSLNPNFRGWIDHFCQWAARQPNDADSPELMQKLLAEFAEIVVPEGYSDSAFLKRATFQMLADRCDEAEDGRRLFEWLHDQIVERRTLAT